MSDINNGDIRVKTVFKKTKAAIKNNKSSGAVRHETPYNREIERIINKDDSILGDFTITPGKINKYFM